MVCALWCCTLLKACQPCTTPRHKQYCLQITYHQPYRMRFECDQVMKVVGMCVAQLSDCHAQVDTKNMHMAGTMPSADNGVCVVVLHVAEGSRFQPHAISQHKYHCLQIAITSHISCMGLQYDQVITIGGLGVAQPSDCHAHGWIYRICIWLVLCYLQTLVYVLWCCTLLKAHAFSHTQLRKTSTIACRKA
jgi:hypothetical protein